MGPEWDPFFSIDLAMPSQVIPKLHKASLEKLLSRQGKGVSLDVVITDEPNVEVRVRSRSVMITYRGYLSGERRRWTLANVQDLCGRTPHRSMDWLKSLIADVRNLSRHNTDPVEHIRLAQFETETDRQLAIEAELTRRTEEQRLALIANKPLSWTWVEAVEHRYEWLKIYRRPAYAKDFWRMMKDEPLFKAFENQRVDEITYDQLSKLLKDVRGRGLLRTPEKLADHLRSMWSWFAKEEREKSNVRDRPMRDLQAPPRPLVGRERGDWRESPHPVGRQKKQGGRPPVPLEIGRVLAVARAVEEVDGKVFYAIDERVACALEVMIFSGQRRRAIVGIAKTDITVHSDELVEWRCPPFFKKTGATLRSNVDLQIWLVGGGTRAMRRLLEIAELKGDYYLLSAFRRQKEGKKLDQPFMQEQVLNHSLRAFGIKWSPHDIRSGFTTYGSKTGLWSEDEASLVLDHVGKMSMNVTRKHYNHDNFVDPKQWMMCRWAEHVEEDYQAALLDDPSLRDPHQVRRVYVAGRYRRLSDEEVLEWHGHMSASEVRAHTHDMSDAERTKFMTKYTRASAQLARDAGLMTPVTWTYPRGKMPLVSNRSEACLDCTVF